MPWTEYLRWSIDLRYWVSISVIWTWGAVLGCVIAMKTRRNLPADIRVATVWYRPTPRTLRTPEYYVHETDDWLVLPYELSGQSLQELRENRPELAGIFDRLERRLKAPAADQ